MSEHSELTKYLARGEPRMKAPYLRPRDAASLILFDRSASGVRILFGKRHDRHAFMPGVFVFPGGRLDGEDRLMQSAGKLDDVSERRLLTGSPKITPARSRALALTAIRETCEETGLLLGHRGAAVTAPSAGWAPFADASVRPNLGALTFVARAITPPGRTRRFDTRFFAADRRDAVHELPGVAGPDSEFVELKWLSFDEARGEKLVGITRVILEEVETRLKAGMPAAMPVPFFYSRNGKFHRDQLA
jgi:8-oxo-dGTP pyrophosphatase MutT (NUDIX family)